MLATSNKLPWRLCQKRGASYCTPRVVRPTAFRRTLTTATKQSDLRISQAIFAQPQPVALEVPVRRADDGVAPQTKALHKLQRAVDRGDVIAAISICSNMKKENIAPDLRFYILLCQLFAEKEMFQEIIAIFDDAVAMGIEPNDVLYNYLLMARHPAWSVMQRILEEMKAKGLPFSSTTYQHIIAHHASVDNLPMCLITLNEMKAANIFPDLPTIQQLVELCCRVHHPRLALELATSYEAETSRTIPLRYWSLLLGQCADDQFVPGLSICWQRYAVQGKMVVEEGLAMALLNCIAATGKLTEIGLTILDQLESSNITLQEHHFSALFAAYNVAGSASTESALNLLHKMQAEHYISPTLQTINILANLIGSTLNGREFAQGYFIARKKAKKTISVEAYHCFLKSLATPAKSAEVTEEIATTRTDMQQAMDAFKQMPLFRLKPNIHTYNILLRGCLRIRHPEKAESVWKLLQDDGLEPNHETMELMVLLSMLRTNYDQAFKFLGRMRKLHMIPSQSLLTVCAKKCAMNFDVRWKLCLSWMEKFGYHVDPSLATSLQNSQWRKVKPQTEEWVVYENPA